MRVSCRVAVIVAAAGLLVTAAPSQAQEMISFQSGDWDNWRALANGAPPKTPVTVTATWHFPANAPAGRLPAVVVMHGASGIGSAEHAVTSTFVNAGYAVLLVNRPPRGAMEWAHNGAADALLSLKAAAADPRIDPQRIAIAGISSGGFGVIGATFERIRRGLVPGDLRYAAHVGFYPNCSVATYGAGEVSAAPMLLLMAGDDTNAPARMCEDIRKLHAATQTPSQITVRVFEGAPHAFLNDQYQLVRMDYHKTDATRCPVRVVVEGTSSGIFRNGAVEPMPPPEIAKVMRECMRTGARMGPDVRAARAALHEAVAFLNEKMGPRP